MEFYENKQEPEKAVLIAVDTGEYDCDISLDELEELAETAGAEVVGRMSQKRDKPDSGTFLGSGRREISAKITRSTSSLRTVSLPPRSFGISRKRPT